MRLSGGLALALTVIGCGLVALGCAVPIGQVCDVFCTGNQRPSLLNDVNGEVSWLVIVPAMAILISLVAAAAFLLAGESTGKVVAGGMLTAAGALTFAFFVALGIPGVNGPAVGAAGGLLIAFAGVAAAAGALRTRSA